MADSEAEQVAWEWFSGAHPHEAHAEWPDRFWAFFQVRCPGITQEQMERTLMETDESPTIPPLPAATTESIAANAKSASD
jgi:hypothetical protein